MSAKEMFEELGYELNKENKYKLSYTFKNTISDTYEIVFFKESKTIWCMNYSDSPFEPTTPFGINVKELQAINKQVEELGWNK